MHKKTISGWALQVTWDDGKEETITEIDDETAGAVDTFLTELEEERDGLGSPVQNDSKNHSKEGTSYKLQASSYKLQAPSFKQRLTMDPGDDRMNLERNNYG